MIGSAHVRPSDQGLEAPAFRTGDHAAPAGVFHRPSRAFLPAFEVAFLLVPEFNMVSFGAAIGPLRQANDLSPSPLYRWRLTSYDGRPVVSSSEVRVEVDAGIDNVPIPDLALVCSGRNVQKHIDPRAIGWLRSLAAKRVALGGIDTGSYVLAKAGVLQGYRCTTHWDHRDAMLEEHPEAVVTPGVCLIDRDRLTCAGGDAPADLMLNFIASQHGHPFAASISEQLVHDRIRGSRDRQRRPLVQIIGTGQPRLLDAVQLMEANTEEPLTVEQIAHHVGLSRRHLERLFRENLGCVPSAYYLRVRVTKAQLLLCQTTLPIMEVALACGFASASHFSKVYKDVFGHSPRDERRPARIRERFAA